MDTHEIELAQEFVAAINRQDVDGLVALMTQEHRFTDSLGNVARGRESMRQAWALYFQMVPDYTLTIDETYAQGAVVMLRTAHGTYSPAFETVQRTGMPTPGGTSKDAQRWETPAAVRALVEDGKVAEWRVYADNEPLRKLMRSRESGRREKG